MNVELLTMSPVAFERHLADTIEAYWLARGYAVSTKVESIRRDYLRSSGALHNDHQPYYKVVSDTLNGLPKAFTR